MLLPCFSGCLYGVSGSGNLVAGQFNYSDFNNIEVSNVFEVDISQSDSYSIDITSDDNIMEYIIIDRSGDILRIGLKLGYSYRSITAVAKINMPDISRFVLSRASSGIINDFAAAGNINIDVSGASSLTLSDLACADVDIEVSGASNMSLESFITTDAGVNISGASTAVVNTEGTPDAEISGASNFQYIGNPELGDISVSGASDFKKK